MVYVSQSEKTDDLAFFTKNPNFKCWITHAGSEKDLHLAILPMFDSTKDERMRVKYHVISKYAPPCNSDELPYDAEDKTDEPEPEPED